MVAANLRRAGSEEVELIGLEPTTPCLQSRCSSQLSYSPGLVVDSDEAI